jgi:hypothetical protein
MGTFADDKTPFSVARQMAETKSWTEDDLNYLSKLPVDDYYSMFKEHTGRDLARVVGACLQFDRIIGASEQMKEISKRAREALIRLGKESRINAMRIREKYGIEVVPAAIQQAPDTKTTPAQ